MERLVPGSRSRVNQHRAQDIEDTLGMEVHVAGDLATILRMLSANMGNFKSEKLHNSLGTSS